jgi:hypothetical protein
MNINPIIAHDPQLKEAFDKLPQPYHSIDDTFLEVHSEELDVFKTKFNPQGGVHLIDLGEHQVICRAPTKNTVTEALKKGEKLNPLDADMYLVGPCLLYPSIDVLNDWMNSGNVGYGSVIAKKLLKIANISIEATAKKL